MIHIITPVMDMVVADQGNRKLEMETDFHSSWDRAIKLMRLGQCHRITFVAVFRKNPLQSSLFVFPLEREYHKIV